MYTQYNLQYFKMSAIVQKTSSCSMVILRELLATLPLPMSGGTAQFLLFV